MATLKSPTKGTKQSRILIIDDEPIMVEALMMHLEEAGFYNVGGVTESLEAISTIQEDRPDAILMDISMPEISGNYLIKEVRKLPTMSDVPIVVVTASTEKSDRERAISMGANSVLNKPVEPTELADQLEMLLSEKAVSDRQRQAARNEKLETIRQQDQLLRLLAGRN